MDLSNEITAFERQLPELKKLGRRWVVFLDQQLQGDFPSFDTAVEYAMAEFPQRDFLVRETPAAIAGDMRSVLCWRTKL